MANTYYPPVNFHFLVTFEGVTKDNIDVMFQSVSGLDVQLETESLKEGGENRFEHVMPVRTKYADLVLKRGKALVKESALIRWVQKALDNYQFEPANIVVKLLDENHKPLAVWNVHHAFPKSWKMTDLNADKGEILIETLELNYNYFQYKDP